MADISTNQPSASRPSTGPESEIKIQKIMAVVGVIFSLSFAVLQLVPIPGLEAVHFGKESYIMLVIWIVIGAVFYLFQRKKMQGNTK